jgi:hypothetical protein
LLGDATFTRVEAKAVESIFKDLSEACSLASPSSPKSSISPLQAKILSAAYTHRAYLLYLIARIEALESFPASLRSVGLEGLMEMASNDFLMGGRYGDKVAGQMSVYSNTYAKLCGTIVKETLKKEIDEARSS